jgi:hypothetical protein
MNLYSMSAAAPKMVVHFSGSTVLGFRLLAESCWLKADGYSLTLILPAALLSDPGARHAWRADTLPRPQLPLTTPQPGQE